LLTVTESAAFSLRFSIENGFSVFHPVTFAFFMKTFA